MFRPLRLLPHALLILVLSAALAFAVATQFPEAAVIERAEGWPLIGPHAERFRAAYVPAATGSGDAVANAAPDAEPAPEIEVVQVIDPDLIGPKPKVWARAGTPILAEPELGAREVGRVEHLFPLSRLERRGDWFRVRYGTRLSGFHKGWVYLPDYREPTADELEAPEPVLPLAPVAIAEEARLVAVRHLSAGAVDGRCGPFALLTDVADPQVLALCERVGSRIEGAHRRRYGLDLVGEAAETIILFEREAAYRAFRDVLGRGIRGAAFASAARGFAAVPVGDRLPGAVEASLIHELTHLLNRRSLGPALPSWLDEGMARDLDTVGVEQPAAPHGIPRRGQVESLEYLFDLDQTVFQMRAEDNYRAAGRWIGYLVAGPDPELAVGMRGFLRAVASGEPIRAELLLRHLGRDWPELESGFRAWEAGDPRVAAD